MGSVELPVVTVRVLGGFRVECQGVELPADRWVRPSARRLLKAMALAEGTRMHRARLAAELWPGAAPRAASRSLRVTLHAVRRTLEPGLMEGGRSAYVLSHGDGTVSLAQGLVRVDLASALVIASETPQRAARALLPELLPDDGHEPFVRAGRRAHAELRRRTSLSCVGRVPEDELIRLLTDVLLVDPLAGEVCQALLGRLIAAGRPGEAVRQYREYREALLDSCGTEPDPPLRELFARALAASAGRSPSRAEVLRPPLAGREAELAFLARPPAPGAPRVVAVTGEPGIGLTRLLDEAASRLRRGQTVHVLHASPAGAPAEGPFGAILAAVDTAVARLAPRARDALATAYPGAAAVLPALRGTMAGATPGVVPEIHALVATLARRLPVVWILDDLDQAAVPVLRMLEKLIRRAAGLPVRFVFSHRFADLRPPQVLTAAHTLTLGRLSRDQCLVLAGDPGRGDALYLASRGNPLCAVEPGRVRQRLAREPAGVREVVGVLSAHPGGRSYAELVRDVDQGRRTAFLKGLEQALRTGWVVAERGTAGPRYELALPAVREETETTEPARDESSAARHAVGDASTAVPAVAGATRMLAFVRPPLRTQEPASVSEPRGVTGLRAGRTTRVGPRASPAAYASTRPPGPSAP